MDCIQKGGIEMKLSDVKIGYKYRITYKITRARQIHWDNGLIPPPGTVVEVLNIRESVYSYPITIRNPIGLPKHCRASDLIKYEGEEYG